MINVGVDAWGMKPVSEDEIAQIVRLSKPPGVVGVPGHVNAFVSSGCKLIQGSG
jgi:hypothetical protein